MSFLAFGCAQHNVNDKVKLGHAQHKINADNVKSSMTYVLSQARLMCRVEHDSSMDLWVKIDPYIIFITFYKKPLISYLNLKSLKCSSFNFLFKNILVSIHFTMLVFYILIFHLVLILYINIYYY